MARSPARSPAPLPLSGERRWHDKEKELQHQHHHQYYTMNMPRSQEQSNLLGQYGKNAPSSAGGATATSSGDANGKTDDNQPASRGMVIFSVLFYLVAALVMVMANKWVLNSVQVPLFFLFVQLVIAVLLLHLSALFGYFTIPKIYLSTCKGLIPLISINVTGLIFNTYCLSYVDASFYQVARGLVLPFTVLFSYLLLKSHSSMGVLGSVAIVCFGFFLGVTSQHLHASPLGTMLGVFSSLTTSVHAIIVKKSLSVVKGSTMDLVYYNNLLSAILLSPLIFVSGESEAVLQMVAVGGAPLKTFIMGAMITGVFGFLICIAGFLSIKVTSPVTHMISSAVRGVIQTFLGMWCFGDVVTAGRGFGILFILAGSTLYTYTKDREQRVKEAIASHGKSKSMGSPIQQSSRSFMVPSFSSEEKSHGISSAHNSPVLSSSSTFENIYAVDPHSRSSTMSLGINVNLANNALLESLATPGSDSAAPIPSPRTPRSLTNRQGTIANLTPPESDSVSLTPSERQKDKPTHSSKRHDSGFMHADNSPPRRLSFDSRTMPASSSAGVTSFLQFSSSPKRPGHHQNGSSYQYNSSFSGGRDDPAITVSHAKSQSVADLQDVYIDFSSSTSRPNKQQQKEEKLY